MESRDVVPMIVVNINLCDGDVVVCAAPFDAFCSCLENGGESALAMSLTKPLTTFRAISIVFVFAKCLAT